MKKLWIFGDSYVAPNLNGTEWPKLLADKLAIEYENFGVDGSSSEHAMREFQRVVTKNTIEDSVIIVLLSTTGRLDLEFQILRPETASQYVSPTFSAQTPNHEWYRENKKHIEWLSVNYNYKSAWLNRACYIHAIKNFAESNLSNTVIVLQNGVQSVKSEDPMTPMGILPPNFILSEVDIDKISRYEMIDVDRHSEFVKHTGWDSRINHLTNPNLEIMAETIKQMILTRDVTVLSYERFQQKIIKQIKTKQQLDEYITAGILHPDIIREIK